MRQVGDTLVWLGLIAVVAAVVYFTPQFASYFSREQDSHHMARGRIAFRVTADPAMVPVAEDR
jgi:hypothetical protein